MDKYEKLLSAVYFNDAETAIQLMETNDYPNKWLDNIFSMGIPIYFITQCNAYYSLSSQRLCKAYGLLENEIQLPSGART